MKAIGNPLSFSVSSFEFTKQAETEKKRLKKERGKEQSEEYVRDPKQVAGKQRSAFLPQDSLQGLLAL